MPVGWAGSWLRAPHRSRLRDERFSDWPSSVGAWSVHPSIDYQGEPRCHYWVRDGRIDWVPNRTRR